MVGMNVMLVKNFTRKCLVLTLKQCSHRQGWNENIGCEFRLRKTERKTERPKKSNLSNLDLSV